MLCKTPSIARSTTDTTTLENVKRLVPRGFYVLTEAGAREALTAKVDAEIYKEKSRLIDRALSAQTVKLSQVAAQNEDNAEKLAENTVTIRTLKRKLFWANAWKITATAAAGWLGTQLLMRY